MGWPLICFGAPTHQPTPMKITIATRESRLALWQAEHVKALLEALGHTVHLLGMTTKGDQILDRSLSKVGGKGLFVKELEVALEEGRADIAVHSLKDVPMDLPPGFALACVMEREDPRDAWVSPVCSSLSDLPPDAVVGTVRIHEQAPGVWVGSRLAVDQAYRSVKGLGKALIAMAVSSARAQGCTAFYANVQLPNVGLFQKLGWQALGEASVHGVQHMFMQANLGMYPVEHDPGRGFIHLFKQPSSKARIERRV